MSLGVPGQAGASALTAQSTTTTTAINPATDRATAQAINLTGTDLPGWQQSPNPTNTSDPGLNNKITACVGGSPGKNDVVKDLAEFLGSSSGQFPSHDRPNPCRWLGRPTDNQESQSSLMFQEGPDTALSHTVTQGAAISKFKVSTFTPTESIPNSYRYPHELHDHRQAQGETLTVPVTVSEITFLIGRAEVSLNEDQKGQVFPRSRRAGAHSHPVVEGRGIGTGLAHRRRVNRCSPIQSSESGSSTGAGPSAVRGEPTTRGTHRSIEVGISRWVQCMPCTQPRSGRTCG